MPQPNTKSIEQILNQSLQPLGIIARAVLKEDGLHILLESEEVPAQEDLVPLVSEEIIREGVESVPKMYIYGRRKGTKKPDWKQEVDLLAMQPPDEDQYEEDLYVSNSHEADEEPLEELVELSSESEEFSGEEVLAEEVVEKPTTADKIKKILPIAAIVAVVLLLGVAGWFFFLNRKPAPPAPAPASAPPPAKVPTPPETPKPGNQTEAPQPEKPGVDPAQGWRLAINKATSAAELTQTAQTKADWETVASQWTEAIELLKIVPSDHPEYDRAQQKIVEYQRNLEYAQRVADSRP